MQTDENIVPPSSSETPTEAVTETATPEVEMPFTELQKPENESHFKKWKETGERPKVAQPKAETPTAESAAQNEQKEPESDARKQFGHKAEKRIKELVKERNTATDELAKMQARIAELEARITPKAETPQEAPKAEPAKPLGKPKLSEFNTYEEFESALDQWHEAREAALIERLEKVAESKLTEAKRKEQEAAEQAAMDEQWNKAASKVAPDFDEVVSGKFSNELLSGYLYQNGLASVAYHLAKNPDELSRISAMHPARMAHEVSLLTLKLAPPPAPTALPKLTATITPPRDIGGGGASPEDPVKTALANQDFKTYKRLMDQREAKKAG